MIRFVDLEDQIIAGWFCFAWYDTVRDEFIEVGGSRTWDTWEEFETDYIDGPPDNLEFTLKRFRSLFPKQKIQQGSSMNRMPQRVGKKAEELVKASILKAGGAHG